MRTLHDARLSDYTTLRLGGRAERLVIAEREADLEEVLRDAETAGGEVHLLGGGSNVVVADEGLMGTVVRIASRGVHVERRGESVEVEAHAGEIWDELVARAVAEGWSGVECLSGIPGSVGATPIQNVGAYGQDVSQVLVSVRCWDRRAARYVELDRRECGFAYRDSRLKREGHLVVTRVRLRLRASGESGALGYAELVRRLGVEAGDRAPLATVRAAILELRRGKGMVVDPEDDESKSAGSFFTNPILDEAELAALRARAADEGLPSFAEGHGRWKVPAAWLIERAGFAKGHQAGGVGISRKHALALVNRGGTTAELLALARAIRDRVAERFGVALRPEPVFLGVSW